MLETEAMLGSQSTGRRHIKKKEKKKKRKEKGKKNNEKNPGKLKRQATQSSRNNWDEPRWW